MANDVPFSDGASVRLPDVVGVWTLTTLGSGDKQVALSAGRIIRILLIVHSPLEISDAQATEIIERLHQAAHDGWAATRGLDFGLDLILSRRSKPPHEVDSEQLMMGLGKSRPTGSLFVRPIPVEAALPGWGGKTVVYPVVEFAEPGPKRLILALGGLGLRITT